MLTISRKAFSGLTSIEIASRYANIRGHGEQLISVLKNLLIDCQTISTGIDNYLVNERGPLSFYSRQGDSFKIEIAVVKKDQTKALEVRVIKTNISNNEVVLSGLDHATLKRFKFALYNRVTKKMSHLKPFPRRKDSETKVSFGIKECKLELEGPELIKQVEESYKVSDASGRTFSLLVFDQSENLLVP